MTRTLIAVTALAMVVGLSSPSFAQDGSVGGQYASCSEASSAELAQCVIDQSAASSDTE